MICNDNQFILISPDLWKFVGEVKENDKPLSYKIEQDNKITIDFEDNKKLSFKQNNNNNKNIINKHNIIHNINENSNTKEINDFYDNINNYYQFKQKIIDKLRLPSMDKKLDV